MCLNKCSNLVNMFLGYRRRKWPAVGYQALCMVRLAQPAQDTGFPVLHGSKVFMRVRGKN